MAQVNDSNVRKEITIGGLVYILEGTVDFKITPKEGGDPKPPIPDPTSPPKPSTFGTIKDGAKWTKNPGKADTWIIKNMDNPPEKKKIVATDGLNIIADLDSEAQAKALIEYFKVNVFPPKDGDGSNPTDPDGPEEPGQGGGGGDGEAPFKTTGKTVPMSQRGVTTRNYSSGKDSDWTIEKNAKGIPFKNIQAVFEIQVPAEWEHDDNLNIKIGGTHMGTGWFSNTVSIYEGISGLGKEEHHPSTQSKVVKGKVYGDLRGKTVGVASTYYMDTNKTQFFVKMPDKPWDLACEAVAVGGFDPENTDKSEVQLRIDGFKEKDKPPGITKFFVNEIAAV